MKYNWTENDFLKQIDLLRTLIKNESDYERKLYLQKVLDSSEYLAYENIGQIEKPNEEIKQRLHSINSERLSYGRYYSIIQNFYFAVSPQSNYFIIFFSIVLLIMNCFLSLMKPLVTDITL